MPATTRRRPAPSPEIQALWTTYADVIRAILLRERGAERSEVEP